MAPEWFLAELSAIAAAADLGNSLGAAQIRELFDNSLRRERRLDLTDRFQNRRVAGLVGDGQRHAVTRPTGRIHQGALAVPTIRWTLSNMRFNAGLDGRRLDYGLNVHPELAQVLCFSGFLVALHSTVDD